MKRKPFWITLIVLGALNRPGLAAASDNALQAAGVAASTSGVTLAECYLRALRVNEEVGISAANVRALEAQYRSEIGAVLPHFDWIKNQFYQQQATAPGGGGATGSAFLTVQPLSYFQLTQPLFAGLRDWYAIRIAKSQEQQAKLNQEMTNLQILSDVGTSFYAALTLQYQLEVLQQTRGLNNDQVTLLDKWEAIGRSRPSDSLSAQTQLATIDAQIEDTKRLIADSRHMLYYQTGVPENVPLLDADPVPPDLTVDDALLRAGGRPDLLSAAESLNQADMNIRFAQGGHLPTLSLTAHSYTERVGFLSDVRWDATFLLDVPLYYGGSVNAQVRAARAQEIISELQLSQLKRQIERQVRTAYDDLSHAVIEFQAFTKAVQLSDKNYQVQQKEYRTGVTSNLELLQLLTNMQDLRRQWLVARANARLADVLLRVAMGETL